MTTMQVKDAGGLTKDIEMPLPPGRAGMAVSRPVVLCSEDSAALEAVASQATLAQVLLALQSAPPVTYANAIIGIGASLSAVVNCSAGRLSRIDMPAPWDAAGITFQVSEDGVQFSDLHKSDGTEYAITAAANQAILLPKVDFAGVQYLKIRSGTSSMAVNQSAARTIRAVLVGS